MRLAVAGITASAARTLDQSRTFQTSQYDSPVNCATKAASRNDETTGEITPAAVMKTATRYSESNRVGWSLKRRMRPAARIASLQLVTNSARTNGGGNTPVCRYKCAGSAAATTTHQRDGRVKSSAVVRIEFGGHRTEGVAGGRRNSSPMSVPPK